MQDIASQFSDWIGTSITVEDEIALGQAQKLAATLDQDPSIFARDKALPQHWYSLFFNLNAPQAQLGPDGHPRKGDFLPPIPLPRRMFVGRSVRFERSLIIGDDASKRSEIFHIEEKAGRNGPLVFLTVRHTISQNGETCLIEDQRVVYREEPSAQKTSAAARDEMAETGEWSDKVRFDPTLVFRYSALTWNGHRIHYDADYARSEEGYPSCVMNGALTVLLTVEAALRAHSGTLKKLEARLQRPMFVGETATFSGRQTSDNQVSCWCGNESGYLAASVELEFAS